jgi:predicted transposase YdaD
MPKKFDAISKTLLELSPVVWPRLAGYVAEKAETIDSDTSTVSGAADKAIRVKGKPDWLMHVEFQAGPDASLPQRMNLDSSILEDRTGLQVHSAVFLLHRKANLRSLTCQYECRFPGEAEPYRIFRYRMVRIWELHPETLLAGGLSSMLLALISNVLPSDLPNVIERIQKQTDKIMNKGQVEKIWTAAYVLMGLTYDQAFTERLLQGVIGMEESVTYQAIIRKGLELGRKQEIHRILLQLGEDQFGSIPSAKVKQSLDQIASVEALEDLTRKLRRARTWEELLGLPTKKPRRTRS